jgi:hypothetical protein
MYATGGRCPPLMCRWAAAARSRMTPTRGGEANPLVDWSGGVRVLRRTWPGGWLLADDTQPAGTGRSLSPLGALAVPGVPEGGVGALAGYQVVVAA